MKCQVMKHLFVERALEMQRRWRHEELAVRVDHGLRRTARRRIGQLADGQADGVALVRFLFEVVGTIRLQLVVDSTRLSQCFVVFFCFVNICFHQSFNCCSHYRLLFRCRPAQAEM